MILDRIPARRRNIGGFDVARLLPHARKRSLGPFVFFDEMGPAVFEAGSGLDVGPHPHIGLATLTYLYEGSLRHQDTTGADQIIEPGAVNLMNAGRGVVHSERSPTGARATSRRLHGLQFWLALPRDEEQSEPSFHHSASVPEVTVDGATASLILGTAWGQVSPVPFPQPALLLDVRMRAGASMTLPAVPERGLFTPDDGVQVNSDSVQRGELVLLGPESAQLEAKADARIIVLGGTPYPEKRVMDWNFVATEQGLLDAARADWIAGVQSNFRDGRFNLPRGETGPIPYPGS